MEGRIATVQERDEPHNNINIDKSANKSTVDISYLQFYSSTGVHHKKLVTHILSVLTSIEESFKPGPKRAIKL